jgi:DNA invertase Pin-like site-specific DNA recombinase
MRDFAFAGRCSTEDLQDPQASRDWQITRSKSLIEPAGGRIVAEFFDAGHSRSLPWRRRPQASALLDALKDPERGFDAVVIGEPQRVFYGNQYGLTYPVFVHYGVQLWVPEVGGPIDPDSEAHDLVMSVFGGMSKAERSRIKVRVRAAMAAQAVLEGRFLGGRPPYGFRIVPAGPHPNPARAADGKQINRLEIDEVAAAVVQRIFAEYRRGRGRFAIAEGLTRDGIPCPSAHDPERNTHRSGAAWSKAAVLGILQNPRYTGHQVWNRHRKAEVLLNVEDVALGYETRLRSNPSDQWAWSKEVVHPVIISRDVFDEVQLMLAARKGVPWPKERRTAYAYQLYGRVHCDICQQKMSTHWAHKRPYYRCRYAEEYALADHLKHPRYLLVREEHLVPGLDEWIALQFTPERRKRTIDRLCESQRLTTPAHAEEHSTAVRELGQKLAGYRALVDSGAGESATVARWIAETENQLHLAQRRLRTAERTKRTHADIAALVYAAGDVAVALGKTPAEKKARLYEALGVKMRYHHTQRKARVTLEPAPHAVGKGAVSVGRFSWHQQ